MDGVSADQEHKFQSAHQLYIRKSFRNLDIPPRMLLPRRLDMHHPHPLFHSPSHPEFLTSPAADGDSDDPYASDEFRMYQFKIRKCTRCRSHDWTDCPFAHPGEKARRRCPRRFGYTGIMCIDFRRGCCVRGDTCDFAHGVFEYWLHPTRYRTEVCKDGKLCQRKICFFAHTSSQLRTLAPADMVVWPNKHAASGHCASCRCHSSVHHTPSPTSILNMGGVLSPQSPSPISPVQPGGRVSPVSRFAGGGMAQHNEVMTPQAIQGLMHSMHALNMNAGDHVPNLNPCLMQSLAARNDDDQSFFSVSPSTSFPCASGSSGISPEEYNFMNNLNEGGFVKEMTAISTGEDFKWVNDLFT